MTHAVPHTPYASSSTESYRSKLSIVLRSLLAAPIKTALWFVVISFTLVHQLRKSLIRRIGVMAATPLLAWASMATPSSLLLTLLILALTSATTKNLLLSLCRKLLATLQALQGVSAVIVWLHKASYLNLDPELYATTPFCTQSHFFPQHASYSDKLVLACPPAWQPNKPYSYASDPSHDTKSQSARAQHAPYNQPVQPLRMPFSLVTPNTLTNRGKKNPTTTRPSCHQETQTEAHAYADQGIQANLLPPAPSTDSVKTQTKALTYADQGIQANLLPPAPSTDSVKTQTKALTYADLGIQANSLPPAPSTDSVNMQAAAAAYPHDPIPQTTPPRHDAHAINPSPISSPGSPSHHLMVLSDADHSILPEQKKPESKTLNCDGNTALHTAIFLGEIRTIALLISDPDIDTNCKNTSGLSPLIYAVMKGQVDIVKTLLQSPTIELNSLCSSGHTALHYATRQPDTLILNLLLADDRIDPNQKNASGDTPLLYSVTQNFVNSVASLLQSPYTDVNTVTRNGLTALHFAVTMGKTETVRLLLTRPDTNPQLQDDYGDTPLHFAASHRDDEIMQLLLAASQTRINTADSHHRTALHIAASHESSILVQLLLSKCSIHPNATDFRDRTALHIACAQGHTETVLALLNCTRVDATLLDNTGSTALHLAVSFRHSHLVKPLIEHTPSLITAQNREQMTALHYAVLKGEAETAEMLIKRDPDCLNKRNAHRYTPLHLACTAGQMELVLRLIPSSKKYVTPESSVSNRVISHQHAVSFKKAIARVVHGDNALHLSVCHGHRDIAAVLLKLWPTGLNTPNDTGDTALHLAAYHGFTALVDLLLAQPSIQIHRTNGLGHTALDLAVNQQHDDTAKTLRTALQKETRLSKTVGDKAPALTIFTDSPATKQKSHAPRPVCLKTSDKLHTKARLLADKENRAPNVHGLPPTSGIPTKPAEYPSCLQDPVGEEPCHTTASSFTDGKPKFFALPGKNILSGSEYWSQQFPAYYPANHIKRPSSEQRNEIKRRP